MKSGPEIQASLRTLAAKWADYSGTERAEAQTFLNELFACYGSDRMAVGAHFEDFATLAGFMDLHWPEVCIVEMKRPGTHLGKARDQVKRYWEESSDPDADVAAARYVVVCSFQEFEVWEPGRFPSRPRATVTLGELADRYDVLAFLIGRNVEPTFVEHHRELTTVAATNVAELYGSLVGRAAAPPDEIQRFVMQTVWCLFAEDLGMLQGWPLQATVKLLIDESDRSPAAEIGHLYRVLNQKGSHNRTGRLSGTAYVNGELFADPAEVDLDRHELAKLLEASRFDWRKVDPTIFGSLLEGLLGQERRDELGAHYTHEIDIMKIVTPTIVAPWRERIAALTSPTAGRELLDELRLPSARPGLRLRELPLRRVPRTSAHRVRAEGAHPGPGAGQGPSGSSHALAVLPADQPARHRCRAPRGQHRPSGPLDGAPADDRAVRGG